MPSELRGGVDGNVGGNAGYRVMIWMSCVGQVADSHSISLLPKIRIGYDAVMIPLKLYYECLRDM